MFTILQKSKKLLTVILAVMLVSGVAFTANGSQTINDAQVIKIIERPGYFETHGNIFHIKPGKYNFVVTNKAGKDAGFVLSRKGEKDQVILVKEGATNNLKTKLESGEYEYYCPIIPTARYKIIVD